MIIAPVLQKDSVNPLDEKMNDLNYWLPQRLVKKVEAFTFLKSQTVDLKTSRIDKSHVIRKKLKA
jgi:hypothetical protein